MVDGFAADTMLICDLAIALLHLSCSFPAPVPKGVPPVRVAAALKRNAYAPREVRLDVAGRALELCRPWRRQEAVSCSHLIAEHLADDATFDLGLHDVLLEWGGRMTENGPPPLYTRSSPGPQTTTSLGGLARSGSPPADPAGPSAMLIFPSADVGAQERKKAPSAAIAAPRGLLSFCGFWLEDPEFG